MVADAGYGKTTLLADFARQTASTTTWYRLEPSDGEWITFLNYLVAAFGEAIPGFGSDTLNVLHQVAAMGATRDVSLGTFLAELDGVDERPVVLVLDDIHAVNGSEDVRIILERIIEQAPEWLSVVLSGRQRPEIWLGRLAAQGRLAELTTEDLRFSRRETEDLLSISHGLRLDDDLLGMIDARTEGWGASLQLVGSSLRARTRGEVRAFVRNLSGAREPLHDFLAEEIIGRQTPAMQRVLVHASLSDRIVPSLVLAALSMTPNAPGADEVVDCLDAADDQGLMTRNTRDSSGRRFHPLLRDFLLRQLENQTSPDCLRELHFRVAGAAETSDWLIAAHHYIEAERPSEAMRVLGESTIRALGIGAWGSATQLIRRMPSVEPPVSVQVIHARALIAQGQCEAALGVLEHLATVARPSEIGLVMMTSASALHGLGRGDDIPKLLTAVIEDAATPQPLRRIADSWTSILAGAAGGALQAVCDSLQLLAREQSSQGLHYYAGISFHNAASVALTLGDFVVGLDLGAAALLEFDKVAGPVVELASTHTVLAMCALEIGDTRRSKEEFILALATGQTLVDVLGDCAWAAAITGDSRQASAYLSQAERLIVARAPVELGASEAVAYASAALFGTEGRWQDAFAVAFSLSARTTAESDYLCRLHTSQALVSLRSNRSNAETIARRGLALAVRQGARRWEARLRILVALAIDDIDELRMALATSGTLPMAIAELADALGPSISSLEPLPDVIDRSIVKFPQRWLPVFRRQLVGGRHGDGQSCREVADLIRSEERRQPGSRLGANPMCANRVSAFSAHGWRDV